MMENGANGGGGNGNGNGSSIGGDSDSSLSDSRVCRDFMRNVCQRGKNCRFVHPENIKIRTDPIFCHDFQQGRCFRSNCKFIHCNRDDEEHFKLTGELPEGVHDPEGRAVKKVVRAKSRGVPTRNGNSNNGNAAADMSEIPLCKDFLKGVCDRPPGGCKFRHVTAQRGPPAGPSFRPTRGRGSPMALVPVPARRRVRDIYEEGPETKRYQIDPYSGYEEEYEIDEGYAPLPPPPPPRGLTNQGYYATYPTSQYTTVSLTRNGYQPESIPYFQSPSHTDAMKALEDENFMLKRRIEELKNSNEFLLNQNAQLRLNNSLAAGTSVTQVQPLAVSAVSVSGAVPSAQPSIIGITSSCLTGTQPLPTISISTLPTVSTIPANSIPVSISQTLQPQSQSQLSQPQIYLPAPPN